MATKRRTREQWQRLVDKQAASELTVSEFCAQHALTVSNFYLWRKKLSDDSQPFAQQDNWLAFDMPASGNQIRDSAWEMERVLPGGVVLRMIRAAGCYRDPMGVFGCKPEMPICANSLMGWQRWYRASWACRRIVVTGLCLSINAAPS